MAISNILLLSPQFRVVKNSLNIYSKNSLRRAQPLIGIAMMATVLENNGYNVKYFDSVIEGIDNSFSYDDYSDCYGLSDEDIFEKIVEFNPDCVAITCMFTSQINRTIDLAQLVKKFNNSVPVIVGGIAPSFSSEKFLSNFNVDYIMKGECDFELLHLIDAINGKIPINQVKGVINHSKPDLCNIEKPIVNNLDDLPFINWDLVGLKRYWENALPQNPFPMSKKTLPYQSSRGCPERCIFCSTAKLFGRKYRAKSATYSIKEIEYYTSKYGVEEIQFVDDSLALNYKRLIDICEGIKDFNLNLCCPNGIRVDYIKDDSEIKRLFMHMKRAGFYQVTFAPESGDEYILNKVIRKKLDLRRLKKCVEYAKEAGMKTHAFFVIGFPYETIEQMNNTFEYAKSLNCSCSISIATPFPGTDLWELCTKENLFIDDFKMSDLLFNKTVIKRFDAITPSKLEKISKEKVFEINKLYSE